MASSKKSVTASKSRSAKSASAPKGKSEAKPALKSVAPQKGKAAASTKAVAKGAVKTVAKAPVVASKAPVKAAAKAPQKTNATASGIAAGGTKLSLVKSPVAKSAAKPAAKAPASVKAVSTKAPPIRAAAKAAAPTPSKVSPKEPKAAAKPVSKSPEKSASPAVKPVEKVKGSAPVKAAVKAAVKVVAKAAAAVETAVVKPVIAKATDAKSAEGKSAPVKAPAKAAAKPTKAAGKSASEAASAEAPAEKISAKPERSPAAGVGQKKEAGTARKGGGRGAKAAPAPVQPIVRLAPARLAMGSSAGPATPDVATKDDAVKAPQTTNAVKPQTAAAPATGAPAKVAEKSAVKPGAHRTGFKVNEFIVYPAHGVGQIVSIDEQEVAGFKLELFVINFMKDKMTLKVPLPKVVAGAIRKLADAATVQKALDTLTGRARVKRTMWSRRAQEYEAKINSGDLQSIAEVVRDLYRSDAQPEQSYSERQLYEAALDRMARELAAVNKLTDSESLKLIESQLQKGPRRGGKAEEADAAEDAEDEGEEGVEEAA